MSRTSKCDKLLLILAIFYTRLSMQERVERGCSSILSKGSWIGRLQTCSSWGGLNYTVHSLHPCIQGQTGTINRARHFRLSNPYRYIGRYSKDKFIKNPPTFSSSVQLRNISKSCLFFPSWRPTTSCTSSSFCKLCFYWPISEALC